MGKWAAEDASPATSHKVNQLVCHSLRNDASNDIATRLAATSALNELDAWLDEKEHLLPVLGQLLSDLSQLLSELELPETRSHVANVLGHIISRAGEDVSEMCRRISRLLIRSQVFPYLEQLAQVLPALFTASADHQVLQGEIIGAMQKLVEALGVRSQAIHAVCCQFIGVSCNPDSVSLIPHFGCLC